MKKILMMFFTFLGMFFLFSYSVMADTQAYDVNIYFFHSNTCGHCKAEEQVLKQIENIYKNVKIYRYEIHEEKSQNFLQQMKEKYHITSNGVPITIIGDTVYIGFREHDSAVKFVKTIEYYSKYSDYQRRIHKVNLDDFMENYQNYSLFGIDIHQLDVSTCSIFLGVLSQINFITMISFLFVFIFLNKIGGDRNKLLLLIFYLFCSILLRMGNVFKNDYFTLVIDILFLIIFMISLFLFYKNKRRQFLMVDIFIVLSILTEYFNLRFYRKYLVMLKNIPHLYLLDGVEKFSYYINYFVSIILLNLTFLLIFYLIMQKKFIKN